ncbi:cytochrome P450 [Aspergillus undulatus]|uniref:cytochrome P450 n=1 Tax=Aspergillus undulatus TaxID=1810928 RepID=UPI003CCD4D55
MSTNSQIPGTTSKKCKKKYGLMMALQVGSQTVILLGTRDVGAAALRRPVWNTVHAMDEKRRERDDVTFEEFRALPTESYGATSATAPLALGTIISMTIEYPAEMRKLQDEIETQVGSHRLPTSSDLPNLPYLQAFIHESLRFKTIGSLGIPHAVGHEDQYMSYKIPEGAIIFPFWWALNHDAKTYPDPISFKPQRWIDNPSLPLPAGFGKRSCTGQAFVGNMLMTVMACLVWGFGFEAEEVFWTYSDPGGCV